MIPSSRSELISPRSPAPRPAPPRRAPPHSRSPQVRTAGVDGAATIEPRTRVNGMLVVQSSSRRSETSLFGGYCDPGRPHAGPALARLRHDPTLVEVVHRLRPLRAAHLDRTPWKGTTWKLWLDGQPVHLTAFGTSDRVTAEVRAGRRKGRRPAGVEHRPRPPDVGQAPHPLPQRRQRRRHRHHLDLARSALARAASPTRP